jgi:lipoprotein-anchoring transpeptidase ErfK/SrfK
MAFRFVRVFILIAAGVIAAAPAPACAAAEKVEYNSDAKPGTIVVQTTERVLYLVVGKGEALKYTVGVGRAGQQWFGTTRIASKHIRPAWKPPASLRGNRSPDFYIESGSPRNPMGAAALVLVNNELAIHGTNNPASIGGFVSAGCIRMHNKDVMDLYRRVDVGTRVVFAK